MVYMKCRRWDLIRWMFLLLMVAYIIVCRYNPSWAEGYARNVYPWMSSTLSAFSSLLPFSLDECFVVLVILWLLVYPFIKRKKHVSWKMIACREVEMLVWLYVWFYMAWGLNYFRYNIYTRLQVKPAVYDEHQFLSFLNTYTDGLNASYVIQKEVSEDILEREVKSYYQNISASNGLVSPKSYQSPKFFTMAPLYSRVGVLGSMGPFFAEARLNAELLPVQIPFTYAHEFSHLLGVSNEAEANYWAFKVCTESSNPQMRFSGYFGLFPYVLINAHSLLDEGQYENWLKSIRPEIVDEYNVKLAYWQERYSPLVGDVQDYLYNLFLKGNQIPSGKKNYAEVIGILLSLQ